MMTVREVAAMREVETKLWYRLAAAQRNRLPCWACDPAWGLAH